MSFGAGVALHSAAGASGALGAITLGPWITGLIILGAGTSYMLGHLSAQAKHREGRT